MEELLEEAAPQAEQKEKKSWKLPGGKRPGKRRWKAVAAMVIVAAIGAAVVFLFFRKFRQGGAAMCGAILLSLLVGNLLLKNLVARDRPCWIDPDFLQLLVSVPKDFSFPSAHTMISVSAAAALFHYSKALGIPALVIAALVGFSRLYLFVHFPTDVLAGAVIGVLLAVVSCIVTDKIAARIKSKKAVN